VAVEMRRIRADVRAGPSLTARNSGPGSLAAGVGPRLDVRAAGAVFERLGAALDARRVTDAV
jgi:hypothetical protein